MADRILPQGDLELLETDTARRLLTSAQSAHLAYLWTDGTPRVVPIWFHWTGEEIVMATFGGAPKIRALQANPDVAVTIDIDSNPPEILSLRGRASVTEVTGVVPEYAQAVHRYVDEEEAAARLEQLGPDTKMARIAVRPTWVGLIDFQSRLPSAVGGVTG